MNASLFGRRLHWWWRRPARTGPTYGQIVGSALFGLAAYGLLVAVDDPIFRKVLALGAAVAVAALSARLLPGSPAR